jgi:hypothetical protein
VRGWLETLWRLVSRRREEEPPAPTGCAAGKHRGMGSRYLSRYRMDQCEDCGETFDVR